MDNPKKILLIQLKRAGDVILATPAAALLKRHFPQSRVDFLVERAFAPLLQNNPSIDGIQVYDKQQVIQTIRSVRAERYDVIFDFQSSPRTALLTLLSNAALPAGYRVPFWGQVYRQTIRRPDHSVTVVQGKLSLIEAVTGAGGESPAPQVFLSDEERLWADQVQDGVKGRRLVGLVPTHRRSSRRWPLESFAALARSLDKAGYAVWLFWGPGERAYVEVVREQVPTASLIPSTSLREMAALLARCELVATNDNGPMHLAAAVGTPTVTLYGPTDPRAWNPGGPRHRVMQAAGVTCLGCNLNECPFGHECMTGVAPSQVFAVCEDLLADAWKAAIV